VPQTREELLEEPVIPLPDKRVCDLNTREMAVFRRWMGYEPGGGRIAYPTPGEKAHRQKRELWKRRYAGKGALDPCLLVREEQIRNLRANASTNPVARRWLDNVISRADAAAGLSEGFFDAFVPDTGPWNPGGNFCPNCVHRKSAEGLNGYFWTWDWKNPDALVCPYCGITYPNSRYPENGCLELPRLGKRYTFHILPVELQSGDWRQGDHAARFVTQPVHVSFTGNIRSLKIQWAIDQAEPLSLAYAVTGDRGYARALERILRRFARVYAGYPLQSYFQDVVDADPGYAVDHADGLPTVFKRNACIGVYDGRHGYGHERTTTRVTRVATGLWGSSRIARELSTTGASFLRLFQAYDLVKAAIAPETRRLLEQDFLLELYLDTRAYEHITNKAGSVRAARVAFGLVYGNQSEVKEGVRGFRKILEGQFHPDGSMKESPLYGHKPIAEDLWRIPEMLRGTRDFYSAGLYRAAMQAFADIATPSGTQPPLDDCYAHFGIPRRTADIAWERCGIAIPGPTGPPSDFAILNAGSLRATRPPAPGRAHSRYYEGRHLACLGYGRGKGRVQLYLLGEDGLRGHRHADPLGLQLYVGEREIFPDLGYICDHPGHRWTKATASHQTVVVDEQNAVPDGSSTLLGFSDTGRDLYADVAVDLDVGARLRRAVTLIRKPDGLPIVVDVFDASGGRVHDYNVRASTPPGHFRLSGAETKPRRTPLYEGHSLYPLLDFRTAGKLTEPCAATWGRGAERVRASTLTPCTELLTYRSPGWRTQTEITSDPKKYFDTLVLRCRRKQSRFVVVYEVLAGGRPSIRGASLEDGDGCCVVRLRMTNAQGLVVRTPGMGTGDVWKVARTRGARKPSG